MLSQITNRSKTVLVNMRYRRLKGLPIRCTTNTIFELRRGATLNIKNRLYLGVRTTALSEGVTAFRVRAGADVLIDGTVKLGPGVIVVVDKNAKLQIGDGTYVAADSKLYASESISIGANCALAWNLTIIDSDFHQLSVNGNQRPSSLPIKIGDHVWIGCNVTILKGVTIGDGAVVAAGSVVTRDIPAGSLAAGNPARVIKEAVKWEL